MGAVIHENNQRNCGRVCRYREQPAGQPRRSQKTTPAKDLVLKGDAKCTSCHDEADSPQLLAIGRTRHGVKADERTPTCTSCHGESSEHVNYKGSAKPPKPDRTFGKNTQTSASDRNEACLTCHSSDRKRHLWEGSAHQVHDVACTSCHQVHVAHDNVTRQAHRSPTCVSHATRNSASRSTSNPTIRSWKAKCPVPIAITRTDRPARN